MPPPERQPLRLTPLRGLLLALGVVLVWVVLSAVAYSAWVEGASHLDFFPRWAGARLVLFEGYALYAPETTAAMQTLLYGAPIPPEQDQQAFAYPAQIILQLAPFWWIDDVRAATAIWQGTSVILFVASMIVLMAALQDVPRWLLVPAFMWQYTLLMLFQGQFTIIPLAALAFGYALYARQHDLWAGLVLALGMVKPELMLIPAAALALHALVTRRFRLLAGLAGAGLALLGVTTTMFGWWVPRWLAEVSAYQDFAQSAYAWQTAWSIHPVLSIGLGGLMALTAWCVRHSPRLLLAGGTTIGMLILPQTLLWGLMLLLVSLLACWRGSARIGVVAVWAIGWATLFFVERTAVSWRTESLVLCTLTLVAVLWASRVPSPSGDQSDAYQAQFAP